VTKNPEFRPSWLFRNGRTIRVCGELLILGKSVIRHTQAEIRRFHAMMLVDRAAPGDGKKAQTLLREALETYTHIGMPRHIEMTQTLLDQAVGG